MAEYNYLKQENVTATAQVTHKEHNKQNLASALYSYDKNISKIVMPVIVAGDKVLDFDTIKRVRILLTFNHDGLQKSIEDVGEIESKDNKTLYYIVTDKLKGFEGNVTMNIYLDLTTDQQIDLVEYGFSMKRSVIDQNIPEIEQFYFKSLDDVIIELQRKSDEALGKINDSLKVVDANLTTANDSINLLTGKANEIQKQIKDQEIVSKSDLQRFLAGEEIIVAYTSDFKNKIPGSVKENPHTVRRTPYSGVGQIALVTPPDFNGTLELTKEYTDISTLDNKTLSVSIKGDKYITQTLVAFDLVTDIDRRCSGLFATCGAISLPEKIDVVKRLSQDFTFTTYGFGSGAAGKKLTMSIYKQNQWYGVQATVSGSVDKLQGNLPLKGYIQDDGCVYIIAYAPASDGVTPSVVNLDYASLEYTLAIKMTDTYALSSKAQLTKVTSDNGTALLQVKDNENIIDRIVSNGAGFTTGWASTLVADSPSSSSTIRFQSNMIDSKAGSVMALDASNVLYTRVISLGKWYGDWQKSASTSQAQMSKITSDNGSVYQGISSGTILDAVLANREGFRNYHAYGTVTDKPSSSVYRFVANMSTTSGNVMGMDDLGNFYARAIANSKWVGEWKKI